MARIVLLSFVYFEYPNQLNTILLVYSFKLVIIFSSIKYC